MNNDEMRAYIRPARGPRIAALIFALITVAALVFSVTTGSKDDTAQAAPFHPVDSETGDYAYIDLIGVSGWLYKIDEVTYYTALDTAGYAYTVRLNATQFKELAAYAQYWNSDPETTPAPEPYRLYGQVYSAGEETAEAIASSWGLNTAEEYYDYFGNTYLDATTSPSGSSSSLWLLLALFCLLLALCLGIGGMGVARHARQSLARLEALGLTEAAEADFIDPETLLVNSGAVKLGKSILFGRHTGAALPYGDIQWIYRKVVRYYFVPVADTLVAYSAGHKGMVALIGKLPRANRYGDSALDAVSHAIIQANPNVLVGYTPENAKAYKEMKRQGTK